jgi:hypothetical protein
MIGEYMNTSFSLNLLEGYAQQGETWVSVAQQLYEAQQLAKYYANLAEQHKKQLKELSGDKPAHGGEYKFDFTERKGSVDFLAIPGIKEMNLEPYRKESTKAWSLTKI